MALMDSLVLDWAPWPLGVVFLSVKRDLALHILLSVALNISEHSYVSFSMLVIIGFVVGTPSVTLVGEHVLGVRCFGPNLMYTFTDTTVASDVVILNYISHDAFGCTYLPIKTFQWKSWAAYLEVCKIGSMVISQAANGNGFMFGLQDHDIFMSASEELLLILMHQYSKAFFE